MSRSTNSETIPNEVTSRNRGLRRVKAMRVLNGSSEEHRRANSDIALNRTAMVQAFSAQRLLRVWLRDPWEDYGFVRHLSPQSQGALAYRKGSYFSLAMIRDFWTPDTFRTLHALGDIHHPNIACIYDVYCHDAKLSIAAEYLPVSLVDLKYQAFPLEEWEIATVIMEVLKGATYLLSKNIVGRELLMSSIRLSIRGDIKLILDPQNYNKDIKHKDSKHSTALLDFPLAAEVTEEMMLPRYHLTSGNDAFSGDALDFLSSSLSDSVETLMKHPFLELAKAPQKLTPRIIFAAEGLKGR